ncbi:MAG: putative pre-16S rRNA nuclease [Fimbriimonadales bacterium]|nr:MAG: putative pre-16S rRNA nuclease [Fimbriimonadales bacterium]
MRIAALDYGAKRVGVAVADTEIGIALPVAVLPNDLEQIARWLRQEHIDQVVMGAPYLMWGARGGRVLEVETFAQQLRERLNIPIELLDERLTTQEAERRLRENNSKRAKLQQATDAVAAAILLETYLRRMEKR